MKPALTLTFDEATHTYRLNGKKLPSVTGILAPLTDFSMVDKDVLERAGRFGTAVHLMAKYHFAGTLDADQLDPELQGCHRALLKWEADHQALQKDHPEGIIIDIKSREMDKPKDSLQLSGYNLIWQGSGRPAGIFIEAPMASPKHQLAGTPDILIASPGALELKTRKVLTLRRDGSYDYRDARIRQDDAMFKYLLETHHRQLAAAEKIKHWRKQK